MSPQDILLATFERRKIAARHRAESARIIREANAQMAALRKQKQERIASIRKEYEGI